MSAVASTSIKESKAVAVIGAGPGGLAAARWLTAYGFEVELYEAHGDLGGQWNVENPLSGVWPQMVTNTFIDATKFSDLDFPCGTSLFPHNSTVLSYLRHFAGQFGFLGRIRFGCRLVSLARKPDGYELVFEEGDRHFTQIHKRVVVATGRFNKPTVPAIPGAGSFAGDRGLRHSFDYKNPERYRDRTVVVLGGSISALEIASDLSMLGAKTVYVAQRRQRYVNQKMVGGVPLEYIMFTYRRGALALDDREALARDDEELVLRYAGDPSRYGAPSPHPEFAKAGVTGSPYYLNLVAEGRLKPVPWIAEIAGRRVVFEDGTAIEADGIIAGTGFALHLPFLDHELRAILRLSDTYIELDEFTFHPDLPGLAFVGLWSQAGSYITPLEQQVRYIAYSWSGLLEHRDKERMRAGLRACRDEGHHVGYRRQNEMALRFARLCGVDPRGRVSAEGMKVIEESAVTGLLFRLVGPDRLADGMEQLERRHAQFTAGLVA